MTRRDDDVVGVESTMPVPAEGRKLDRHDGAVQRGHRDDDGRTLRLVPPPPPAPPHDDPWRRVLLIQALAGAVQVGVGFTVGTLSTAAGTLSVPLLIWALAVALVSSGATLYALRRT